MGIFLVNVRLLCPYATQFLYCGMNEKQQVFIFTFLLTNHDLVLYGLVGIIVDYHYTYDLSSFKY